MFKNVIIFSILAVLASFSAIATSPIDAFVIKGVGSVYKVVDGDTYIINTSRTTFAQLEERASSKKAKRPVWLILIPLNQFTVTDQETQPKVRSLQIMPSNYLKKKILNLHAGILVIMAEQYVLLR